MTIDNPSWKQKGALAALSNANADHMGQIVLDYLKDIGAGSETLYHVIALVGRMVLPSMVAPLGRRALRLDEVLSAIEHGHDDVNRLLRSALFTEPFPNNAVGMGVLTLEGVLHLRRRPFEDSFLYDLYESIRDLISALTMNEWIRKHPDDHAAWLRGGWRIINGRNTRLESGREAVFHVAQQIILEVSENR
jgi:hypothetical protein